MSKSIIIKKNGGPEVLVLQDVDIKLPGPDEIKVTNLAIGLNYIDHAKEVGAPLPKEPIMFLKPTSSLAGPFDDVMLPKGVLPKKGKTPARIVDSKRSDWEVELGVVIGDIAKAVPESKAMQYVAGYTIINDVSDNI